MFSSGRLLADDDDIAHLDSNLCNLSKENKPFKIFQIKEAFVPLPKTTSR